MVHEPVHLAINLNKKKPHFEKKEIVFKDGNEGRDNMRNYLINELAKMRIRFNLRPLMFFR